MKIGVMLPNWIGDIAMATPALRALRRHFADAKLVGIVRPYGREVLEGTKWLDDVIPWEHRGTGATGRWLTVIAELRRERFETLVLMRHSFLSALTARMARARRIVGFGGNGRGWLLNDRLVRPQSGFRLLPYSAVDQYLELAYQLGCPQEPRRLELATSTADEALADAVWERLGLPDRQQVVLLNTGGAYGEAKHWPIENYVGLARRIADELGLHVLVNCGPKERETARSIVESAGHPRIVSLADEEKLPLGLTKACIRRSRVVVTTDSGPRHLAAGLGTPTVVLFGPIDPRWSENYQEDCTQLYLQLDCSPCGRRTCPLGHHRCMRDLTVERVFRAVVSRLQRPLSSAA